MTLHHMEEMRHTSMSDDVLTGWKLIAQLLCERNEPLFSLSVTSIHGIEVLEVNQVRE